MSSHDLQDLLVRRGLVAQDLIRQAQIATRGTEWTWLERLLVFGELEEEAVIRCAAQALHVPRCPRADLVHVSSVVLDLLPAEVASEHRVVPVGLDDDGDLRLAMMDPTDLGAVAEVEFFAGRRVLREAAVASDLAEALLRHYGVASVLWPRATDQVSDRRMRTEATAFTLLAIPAGAAQRRPAACALSLH